MAAYVTWLASPIDRPLEADVTHSQLLHQISHLHAEVQTWREDEQRLLHVVSELVRGGLLTAERAQPEAQETIV